MTEPWAYRTMNEHLDDEREYLYTIQDYQDLKTHDPYFNACMRELLESGYMHNYMRMYWAKKIIEWSKSYHEAFSIIKTLNDTYLLDGRDPSSYAGIAWCFGKHDRPWQERPIFGKLRTMTEGGLKRKFAIDKYVARWQ
jgi:deoxyribodipyrimidine photo-lyase